MKGICDRCHCEIDTETCWCGDQISSHATSEHMPVEMGCRCFETMTPMSTGQILADVTRAVQEAFPDRADKIMRAIGWHLEPPIKIHRRGERTYANVCCDAMMRSDMLVSLAFAFCPFCGHKIRVEN